MMGREILSGATVAIRLGTGPPWAAIAEVVIVLIQIPIRLRGGLAGVVGSVEAAVTRSPEIPLMRGQPMGRGTESFRAVLILVTQGVGRRAVMSCERFLAFGPARRSVGRSLAAIARREVFVQVIPGAAGAVETRTPFVGRGLALVKTQVGPVGWGQWFPVGAAFRAVRAEGVRGQLAQVVVVVRVEVLGPGRQGACQAVAGRLVAASPGAGLGLVEILGLERTQ